MCSRGGFNVGYNIIIIRTTSKIVVLHNKIIRIAFIR